ncbi:MAG: aspartate aminotransferase family protein [Candidatus Dormibacteraeota bacterium]|nr:aspartate aminotransferase family protein [Candidatus Dormibacteraeota bacterium]
MSRAGLWRERDAELIAPVYSRYSDLVVESAEGSTLMTVDGRRVLDFGCGIGVTNLGHRHPAVVAAVHQQVDTLWHTSVTAMHPQMIDAAAALVGVAPEGLDQVFFNNSGAEATETAIKLARRATGRQDIIAFIGGFHGRTYGAMSLTASKAKYRGYNGPFLPGVHHVRYPYCLRYCSHGPGERCAIAEGEDIELLFKTRALPDTIAAVIVEPVQGEGGFVVPPPSFLPALRRICDEHGILLIVDEVQSGMGRTGRMFGVQHFGVTPDIMCVAKALANGLPIGGVVAKHSVMAHWHPGEHGTTFGGNAVACAALIAVIETMQRDRIPERAARLGKRAMERARSWQQRVPGLAEVRGLGLMIGLEFLRDGRSDAELVSRIVHRALERDLLLLTSGPDDNVIRIMPPLTISEEELDRGLDIIEQSIMEAAAA